MGLFSKKAERIQQAWTFETNAGLLCRPTTAQFSNGSRILIGTKDGRVICLNDAGQHVWTFSTKEELSNTEQYFVDEERVHSFDHPPVVVDINQDGKQEVLVGSELGILYCLSEEGSILWQRDLGAGIRAAPSVSDVNMDGHPEVLIGAQDHKLSVLSNTGEILFQYVADSPIESTPGVMKSHGKTLIVFGTTAGELYAITAQQDVVWKVSLGDKISAQPAFFRTKEEQRLAIGTLAGSMWCVSEHGERVWEFKTNGSIYNKVAVHDLDADGQPDIVFGSCDNSVYAVTGEGKKLWSYETDFWVTDTPLVADIDGDGNMEVVAGSYDHNVYVLDSRGQYMMDYVPGISGIVNQAGHYANVLTSDPGEQAGKKRYQFHVNNIVVGCSLVGSQHPSVVVSTKAGTVSALRHG